MPLWLIVSGLVVLAILGGWSVTVEGASFITESGAAGDSTLLQAAIGRPVIYKKYSSNPDVERVVINAPAAYSPKADCYIGKPIVAGDDANPSNFNIIDGFDATGPGAKYGLRLIGSSYNVFRNGKIYELDSVACYIGGNSTHKALYNIIQSNVIYNTSKKAIKIGLQNGTSTTNFAKFNIFKGNEIYSTGSGSYPGFITMAEIHRYNTYNILENNMFRDFTLMNANRAGVEIWDNTKSTLVYGNTVKNVARAISGTNANIYIHGNSSGVKVFNNLVLKQNADADNIYAFRLNAAGHSGTVVAFNTVYNINKGILFEDSGSPVPDFKVQDNIFKVNNFYFTHTGTGGRFTLGYNCYFIIPTQSGGSYYLSETGKKIGDALFVNPLFYSSYAGFRLQTASICLNSGTPVSGISRDYLKSSRDGTNPTIGAFETTLTSCNWTGAVSSDWHDYRNWDSQLVPVNTIDVIIPDRLNDPVISSQDGNCKTISIQAGAHLDIQPGRLLNLHN